MNKLRLLVALVPTLAMACGGGTNNGRDSAEGEDGLASDGADTAEGNDAGGDGDGDGDGDSQGDGDGDGDSQGDGDGDGDGDDGGGPRFDVNTIPDAPPCAGGGGGDPEFSYIWVANSSQNTISKIDTQTLVEEGRYMTRPDGAGSPSRTSVSLTGHVAVANRQGGVTKVYALEDACEESNGMPGIQTATDANFLSWDQEECRAWHTPMNYSSQRPVAWAQGVFNPKTCAYEDEKLWTSGANGSIDVLLLNGDDGTIEETVNLAGISTGFYGIYGAAVDGDGNFWGSQLGQGQLVKVDREDMTWQQWPMATSGYGMTVDHEGYVWTCSSNVGRFDPDTETWQTANVGGTGGCMGDGDNTLWVSAWSSGLVGVNMETLQVDKAVNFNNTVIHGASVDFYGYVWGVSYNTPYAYRVDPETLEYETFTGLTGPYTYSDMTGFALSAAGTPSG